jgi:ammonium transporter, Amt family
MTTIDGIDLDSLNYTTLVPYNGTGPTGGDSLTENLNIWYEVSHICLCRTPTASTPQKHAMRQIVAKN